MMARLPKHSPWSYATRVGKAWGRVWRRHYNVTTGEVIKSCRRLWLETNRHNSHYHINGTVNKRYVVSIVHTAEGRLGGVPRDFRSQT